ncbi:MAG: DUF1015 domain-containing protein [Solirubrobacterales bacterium]|nr:DUF1015 domain-containing protein [Solirubrobacterales bacterium]
MADVQPLRALHYDFSRQDGLKLVTAPPYDVIDPQQREELLARSPHNVVEIDLPQGDDPYERAASTFNAWQREGVLVRDDAPAIWALTQDYTGPDGRARTRRGIFARIRVEDYGRGRIRPHERTHPGPKEDRLRLTRATRANLSPIFSLYDDPDGTAWSAIEPQIQGAEPVGEVLDEDGTRHRLWRVADSEAIAAVRDGLAPKELLIADGHHRYETARVYAEEIGGEGAHRFVLMCLVALQDPGLTIFPTHRLVRGLTSARQEALAATLREHFKIEPIEVDRLRPPDGDGPLVLGYIDAHFRQAFRLTLRDRSIADVLLSDRPEPYRRLDTAVLEALILKGPLELSDDQISHLDGFGYSRTDAEALELVESGAYDAAFFLRPSPVAQVSEIAAAGETMPPKSTYFFPKLLTGMLFNPLDRS